ncbi:MAG: 50S ribosomal protein L11 methyltransferase [Christensenellales bacterium]
MNWKQVNVKTSDEMSDIVSSVLLDAGAHGVEIVGGQVPDAGECESGAVANGNDVTVKAYYGEYDFERVKAYIRGRIESLKMLGVPEAKTLAFDVCTVKDADWNENFKKHFKAFRAAGRIVVKPTWEEFKANKDDIVIEIDPGMAFGSGVHETTRMCLELLQKYIKRGDAVLDVGCGSGILAIAAAKLGAGHVLALDYDNVSVRVAMDNAETNGARVVEVRESDLLQRADTGPYNIIMANIIADTIIKLNKKAGSALARGGIYIVSGIIGERLNEVADSLKNRGYSVIEKINIGEWFALAAVRDIA